MASGLFCLNILYLYLRLENHCSPFTYLKQEINWSKLSLLKIDNHLANTISESMDWPQQDKAAQLGLQGTWVWHWMTSTNIRRIRPLFTQEVVQVLGKALVILCLDYCNSLMVDVTACTIQLPPLHHSSAPCTGYRWLLEFDSRH